MSITPTVSLRLPHFSIYGEGLDQFTGVKARNPARRAHLEQQMLKRHGARPLYRVNVMLHAAPLTGREIKEKTND